MSVGSIKHRILATFNINKKNQFEPLYAFNEQFVSYLMARASYIFDDTMMSRSKSKEWLSWKQDVLG
jgi:hypothetical protein